MLVAQDMDLDMNLEGRYSAWYNSVTVSAGSAASNLADFR